jgi:hypothetical protein
MGTLATTAIAPDQYRLPADKDSHESGFMSTFHANWVRSICGRVAYETTIQTPHPVAKQFGCNRDLWAVV